MKPPAAVQSWGRLAIAASVMLATAWGAVPALLAILALVLYHNWRLARANAEAARQIERHNCIIALTLNEDAEGHPGWIWETDGDGRLVSCSRGLAQGLGQPASALIGEPFSSLFAADACAAGWDRLLLAMAARQEVSCAAELAFGNARHWWQISSHPVFSGDGAFAGHRGVAHNITAERHARRKLAEERDTALRDNASKSQFLSLMSHELRTPLDAIVGYTGLLLSPSAADLGDAQRRAYLHTMHDSSRNLQSLISGILDVSRIEKGKLQIVDQEIDAAEIAEVAVKMCRDAAEKADITIVAEVIEGIELRCDATRISQVLVSLVTNAIKLSSPGGTVRLEFEAPGDGSLVIAVQDRGMGIAPEDLARVFDPFVQAELAAARHAGGMGLSLPIARRIAVLHGGDVTIASAEGLGTTSRLILPPPRVTWPASELSDTVCAA